MLALNWTDELPEEVAKNFWKGYKIIADMFGQPMTNFLPQQSGPEEPIEVPAGYRETVDESGAPQEPMDFPPAPQPPGGPRGAPPPKPTLGGQPIDIPESVGPDDIPDIGDITRDNPEEEGGSPPALGGPEGEEPDGPAT